MHWFWRAVTSVFISCVLVAMSWDLLDGPAGDVVRWARGWSGPLDPEGIVLGFLIVLPAMLVGFASFGIMTRLWPPSHFDPETRCRKCGYILRGISEPRCPECGERI